MTCNYYGEYLVNNNAGKQKNQTLVGAPFSALFFITNLHQNVPSSISFTKL